MSTVEVVLVDAFTSTPFTGNPAAVVPDATGLDEATMRAIAAEMARPATAFLRPAAAGGTRGLRWFSPAGIELTLCGHGTVAAAHVLAARGEAPRGQLVFEAPRHRLAIALEGSGTSGTASVRAGRRRVEIWETGGLPAAGGVARFRAEQGDFQGRPGRIAVEVHGVAGRATRVRVGGEAVIVLTGQLSLP